MNIVFVIHDTNPLCGANKALIHIIDSLLENGNQVSIIAPNNYGFTKIIKERGANCFVVPFRNGTYPSTRTLKDKLLFIPKLFVWRVLNKLAVISLSSSIRGQKIDIIHSNSSVIDIGYRLAKKNGVCHLFHIREYVNDYMSVSYFPSNHSFERKIKAGDKYSYSICIIPDLQLLFSLCDLSTSRVIYDGVMSKKYRMVHPEKKGYLIYIGRIEPQKGLLQLIDGYVDYLKVSKIKRPLKVLGSINNRDYYNKIKKILEDNHFVEYVDFLGMQENVDSFLLGANGIIISSLSEGFGFCMAEAMFNECPVIGYDVSGTHQQFENGLIITGEEIGYRYTNRNELKNALLMLECSDNTKMIENAWKTVNTLYSHEKSFNMLYNFYNFIVENEHKS